MEYVWEHAGEWRSGDDFLLPDVGIDIALRISGAAEAFIDGRWSVLPKHVVVGSLSGAVALRHSGRTRTLGIRLPPGNARLLAVPAAQLRGIIAPLSDVAPHLDRRLASFSDRLQAADASAEDVWAALAPFAPIDDDPLTTALARRLAARSDTIAALADRFDMSRRHLTRCFQTSVGWTPTDFRRVGRLSRAVSIAALPHVEAWAEVALEAGYSDQSHLIRDFKELTGETPSRIFPRSWYENFD